MGKYTKREIDALIKQATKRTDARIDKAIERAVGFYYEKTKHDIDLVLESTSFIKERLADMVTRDEFTELTSEVKLIRRAVTDTNKELRRHDNGSPGWDTPFSYD